MDNDVTLEIRYTPPNALGIFTTSMSTFQSPGPVLCLGGATGRFNQPHQILISDSLGNAQMQLDLDDMAQPTGSAIAMAGQTWYFQVWFRDSCGVPNRWGVSDALALTFE